MHATWILRKWFGIIPNCSQPPACLDFRIRILWCSLRVSELSRYTQQPCCLLVVGHQVVADLDIPSWNLLPALPKEDRLHLAFVEADCVGLGSFSVGCGTGLEFGCHSSTPLLVAAQATSSTKESFLSSPSAPPLQRPLRCIPRRGWGIQVILTDTPSPQPYTVFRFHR